MRIIRVFPRRTRATPDDEMAYTTEPYLWSKADEIHISVTFTYDIQKAEKLAKIWKYVAPVKIGGPGIGMVGKDFVPGMYLKRGYVITSRGCPNKCWFCDVWKRDGNTRELPITEGWNVLDDNILACSEDHIRKVFVMLRKQEHVIEFTGGLEAARLKSWMIDELLSIRLKQMFFAYDTPDDYEPLVKVSKMLIEAGFNRSHKMRCFVLIGYHGDTFDLAEKRLREVIKLEYMPMAMLWRNKKGDVDRKWRQFQREWAIPMILAVKMKEILG